MQLLVSVRSASEAQTALLGGAQIIDAKEPAAGALGPVIPAMLAQIRNVVPDAVPLSAALGDVAGEAEVEQSLAGIETALAFVKLGFLGVRDSGSIERSLNRAVKGATGLPGNPRVVAVGYADWQVTGSLDPRLFPEIVRRAGAHGLLIDTALKENGRLFDFLSNAELAAIGRSLHRQELLYAVAGSLGADDVPSALETGADILGVRGAATIGGRNGKVDASRVARLARLLQNTPCALTPESP